MVILEQNRRNRRISPLFPYLLIYRTEEVEGTSPEIPSGYSKQDGFAMSTNNLLIYYVGLHTAPVNGR